MKKLEVIIQPFMLDEVMQAVTYAGTRSMTITDVRGYSPWEGHRDVYRGQEYVVELPQIKIEMVVPDELSEDIVAAVLGAMRARKIGDGRIIISDITDVARISTGHWGEFVLYS